MANDAHIKELKLGVNYWNNWRRHHFAEMPDLSGADLSGLNLVGVNLIGANLSKANLSLSNLNGAFLSCANLNSAYLSEATLCKANLSKADLTKADLSFADLTEATLIEADLNRATLIETVLVSANLSFADLNRANLSKANLQEANLTKGILIEAILNNANLRACNFNQAIASEASLREANLIEARLNKADFSFANFIEANLRRANLNKVILIEANLRGASLREALVRKGRLGRANLGNVDFAEADISEANLAGCDMIRSDLSKTNFTKTNLHEAKISGANLSKAIFAGTNLSEADLSETDLTKTDFTLADLSQADLTRSKIAATNFTDGLLNGICLEDAQLSSTAQLEGVSCDYIYLKRNNQDRRPNEGTFVEGEFAQLFLSALETLNLTLHAGVNWTAIAYSIKLLNTEKPAAQLGIQSIENKGDGIILLKLSTAPGIDTVQIHRDFMRIYEDTKQKLESRHQLNARDALLAHGNAEGVNPRDSINQLFELLNPSMGLELDPLRPAPRMNPVSISETQTPAFSISTTADAATAIRSIMDDLSARYPDATEAQRGIVAALEIQQMAKRDDAFCHKLTEAVQSSSLLMDQIFRNNPFLHISFEMVREWLNLSPIILQNVAPAPEAVQTR